MTGVCIEDVNHEIYGGISSQMVFGESFQEPPATAIEGFTAYGGDGATDGGAGGGGGRAPPGEGPRPVAHGPPPGGGGGAGQVRVPPGAPGRAGLILKVNNSGADASRFTGYEVALDPGRQHLVFGRHRGNGNWEPIRDVPCAVPVGPWIDLSVRMTDTRV